VEEIGNQWGCFYDHGQTSYCCGHQHGDLPASLRRHKLPEFWILNDHYFHHHCPNSASGEVFDEFVFVSSKFDIIPQNPAVLEALLPLVKYDADEVSYSS